MDKLPIRLLSVLTLTCFFISITASPVLAAITYTYDANGNMLSNGTNCYEYNEANQVKRVKKCSNNETIAEYIYDSEGTRIIKKEYENGVLKATVYSPADEYQTRKLATNSATQNTTYYKANDEAIAQKNPDGSISYHHNDHLGSNTISTNQSGLIIESTSYEPYGEVKSGGTQAKFQFTGQEKDQESGLSYYDSRYYDPHIQRFAQPDSLLPDPYDPQQLNRYSYVRNNPLRYTDPSGHCIGFLTPFCGAIISAVAKIFQPVVNLVTKIASKPTSTQVTQNTNKIQSNPLAQKAENAAGQTGVNGSTITQAGKDSSKYLSNNPQTGWEVGDPINNLTPKGNNPSWSTVRQRFWKNEAELNPTKWTTEDLERMRKGLAPQRNAQSLELDHWPAQRDGGLFEFNIVTHERHLLLEQLRREAGLYLAP